jgi:hypothetical protein
MFCGKIGRPPAQQRQIHAGVPTLRPGSMSHFNRNWYIDLNLLKTCRGG